MGLLLSPEAERAPYDPESPNLPVKAAEADGHLRYVRPVARASSRRPRSIIPGMYRYRRDDVSDAVRTQRAEAAADAEFRQSHPPPDEGSTSGTSGNSAVAAWNDAHDEVIRLGRLHP